MLMVLSIHGTLLNVLTIVFIIRTVPLKKLMKHIYNYKLKNPGNRVRVEKKSIENDEIWVFLKLKLMKMIV